MGDSRADTPPAMSAGDGMLSPGQGMETGGAVDGPADVLDVVALGRSCAGLSAACGAGSDGNCCASSLVPGGTFNRGNDPFRPASLSDFRLDVYEVTVGRFRNFVADYPASKPSAGSGKNPNDPSDTGWDEAWPLPVDQEALIRRLHCDERTKASWRDTPEDTETLPMNCIDWLVSYAFCIWDGGRLPTEAEWNYAAAGGSQQRYYPWSDPPASETIDSSHAVFGSGEREPPVSQVGSRSPLGDGRWGHADLAGNLWEFTLDPLAPYPAPCIDCKTSGPPDVATPPTTSGNAIRGGGFYNQAFSLWSGARSNMYVTFPEADIGARCAREP